MDTALSRYVQFSDPAHKFCKEELIWHPLILSLVLRKNVWARNLKECVKHFDTSDPGVDWCAWFVRQCGAKADMNFGSSNTASKLWGLNGNFAFVGSNFPKEGDLAFTDPKGNDNITHIGIISEITDDQIITVEGNMSGDTIYDSIVKNGKYDF